MLITTLGSLNTLLFPKENKRFRLSTFKTRCEEVNSNAVKEDGNTFLHVVIK